LGGYETGWWGVPGGPERSAKVHVLNTATGKPLCGGKHVPASEFQWCTYGIYLRFVTCPRCRERAKKILAKED
jgi:hypothetical protein